MSELNGNAAGAGGQSFDSKLLALQSIVRLARSDQHAVRYRVQVEKGFEWRYRTDEKIITDEMLRGHLNGGKHRGVYLMKPGTDTTAFAVLDIDDHEPRKLSWADIQDAARKIIAAAAAAGLRAWAVRSGSGHGIHLFFFWDGPQSAAAVRVALIGVLVDAGYVAGNAGLPTNEIEVFPKQDAVPEGFYGNLIALPFGRASVPLGDDLEPCDVPRRWTTSRSPEPVPEPDDEEAGGGGGAVGGADPAVVADALKFIPADEYDRWIKVAMALYNTFGDAGFDMWAEWSRGAPDKFKGDKDLRAHWKSFQRNKRAKPVTIGTVFYYAGKGGWINPRKGKGGDGSSYRVINGRITYIKRTANGDEIAVPMTNFAAWIEESLTIDDGGGDEPIKVFKISGTARDGAPLRTVMIPGDKVHGMWWFSAWDANALVEPGWGVGRFSHALGELSKSRHGGTIPVRTVYGHIGWRQIGGGWFYLHAGGAIGKDGPVEGIECSPGGPLSGFRLPPVTDLRAAVRASLRLFDLGPLGSLAFAFAYRAPLCEFLPAGFSGWLTGRTGSLKSSVAAIAQAHWGATWGYRHLPAGWNSSFVALEKMAFLAKDALFTIDDYAPQKTESGRKAQEDKAQYVLRAQGNGEGRFRLKQDTSLRDAFPPRGIILGTGEDVPAVASLRARLVIMQTKQGDIELSKIIEIDRECAKTGLLAQAMGGYVQWLAGCTDTLRQELADRSAELTDPTVGSHARTSNNLASLLLGVEQGLAFAVAAGAIDENRKAELRQRAETDLRAIATEQAEQIDAEDEVTRFLSGVQSALMSGAAHVITKTGVDHRPDGYETVTGWQSAGTDNAEETPHTMWRPQGHTIGWLDLNADQLLLNPEPALIVVQQLARAQGGTISLTVPALGKRLKEAGKLTDSDPGRNTHQVKIRSTGHRLWVLSAKAVLGIEGEPKPLLSPEEKKAAEQDEDACPF